MKVPSKILLTVVRLAENLEVSPEERAEALKWARAGVERRYEKKSTEQENKEV